MKKQVKKAVIPVAGFGTRLLPVTKSVPKELLPLVDVPAIQVIVEECIASGIEEVVLITGRGKGGIADHFDYNYELERLLEERGKFDLLEKVRDISSMIRTVSVRQKKPLGLGHAVLCAKDVVGDEPFLVLLPDDIITSTYVPVTKQMLEVYDKYGEAVVSVMEVPMQEVSRYGIVAGEQWSEGLYRVRTLVEKPDTEFAPSNIAIIGRYLLPPVVFDYLQDTLPHWIVTNRVFTETPYGIPELDGNPGGDEERRLWSLLGVPAGPFLDMVLKVRPCYRDGKLHLASEVARS